MLEGRPRAGSTEAPPLSPKDKRKDSSPLKSEKKGAISTAAHDSYFVLFHATEGLGRRLSKILRSSKSSSGKSQPVAHYVTVFKKKTVSKQDMLSLQEDARSQSQPNWYAIWLQPEFPSNAFLSV